MPPNREAVLAAIAAKVSIKTDTNSNTYTAQYNDKVTRESDGPVVLSR